MTREEEIEEAARQYVENRKAKAKHIPATTTMENKPWRRIRVVTMIGGLDLIGELEYTTCRLWRPFALHGVPGRPVKISFTDMTKTGLYCGEFIELNMLCVMWQGEPSPAILKAYDAIKAGIVLPDDAQDFSVNQ